MVAYDTERQLENDLILIEPDGYEVNPTEVDDWDCVSDCVLMFRDDYQKIHGGFADECDSDLRDAEDDGVIISSDGSIVVDNDELDEYTRNDVYENYRALWQQRCDIDMECNLMKKYLQYKEEQEQ